MKTESFMGVIYHNGRYVFLTSSVFSTRCDCKVCCCWYEVCTIDACFRCVLNVFLDPGKERDSRLKLMMLFTTSTWCTVTLKLWGSTHTPQRRQHAAEVYMRAVCIVSWLVTLFLLSWCPSNLFSTWSSDIAPLIAPPDLSCPTSESFCCLVIALISSVRKLTGSLCPSSAPWEQRSGTRRVVLPRFLLGSDRTETKVKDGKKSEGRLQSRRKN